MRRYASTDVLPPPDPKKLKIPAYWVRPRQPLSAEPGNHRFLWDLHHAPLPDVDAEYPMTAIYRNTPEESTGPWAVPGDYSLVLNVNGQSYTQPLSVKMDPRVKASPADLAEQFELSKKLYDLRARLEPIGKSFDAINEAIGKAKERAGDQPVKQQLEAFGRNWKRFAPPNPRPGSPLSFAALDNAKRLFGTIQDVDAAPTARVKAAVEDLAREAPSVVERWQTLVSQDLPALNRDLKAPESGSWKLRRSEGGWGGN